MLVPLDDDFSPKAPRLPIPEGGAFHQRFTWNALAAVESGGAQACDSAKEENRGTDLDHLPSAQKARRVGCDMEFWKEVRHEVLTRALSHRGAMTETGIRRGRNATSRPQVSDNAGRVRDGRSALRGGPGRSPGVFCCHRASGIRVRSSGMVGGA